MEDRALAEVRVSCPGYDEKEEGRPQPDISLFAIYDGHGGDAMVKVLYEALFREVKARICLPAPDSNTHYDKESLPSAYPPRRDTDYRRILDEAFAAVDHDSRLSAVDESGSTAVLALLLVGDDNGRVGERNLYVANVGNSRALLCRATHLQGLPVGMEPLILSHPHECGQPEERARIITQGGRVVVDGVGGKARLEGDLELSRAFGDFRYRDQGLIATPEVTGPTLLTPGDKFLILVSDGVLETMEDQDICDHVHAASRLGRGGERGEGPPLSPPRSLPIVMGGKGADPTLFTAGLVPAFVSDVVKSLSNRGFISSPRGYDESLVSCCDCVAKEGGADKCGAQRQRGSGPPTAAQIADRLVTEAYNRGSMDNLAAVAVDLGSFSPSSSLVASTTPSEGEAGAQLRPESGPSGSRVIDGVIGPSDPEGSLISCPLLAEGDRVHGLGGCSWGYINEGKDEEGAARDLVAPSSSSFQLTHRLQLLPTRQSNWHAHTVSDDGSLPTFHLVSEAIAKSWRSGALALHLLLPSRLTSSSSSGEQAESLPVSVGTQVVSSSSHMKPADVFATCLDTDFKADFQQQLLALGGHGEGSDDNGQLQPFLQTCLLLRELAATPTDKPLSNNLLMVGPVLLPSSSSLGVRDEPRPPPPGFLSFLANSIGHYGQKLLAASLVHLRGEEKNVVSVPLTLSPHVPAYDIDSRRVGGGHFGEVWRAKRHHQVEGGGMQPGSDDVDPEEKKADPGEGDIFVLKRLMIERGENVRLSGLRESYFGRLLQQAAIVTADHGPGEEGSEKHHHQGYDHVVRFIESFWTSGGSQEGRKGEEAPGPDSNPDLWLVFHDEGVSLHDLMYKGREEQQRAQGFMVVGPSEWWQERRRDPQQDFVRSVMRQLLTALDLLHSLNITHRDVKPENLLVREGSGGGTMLHVRLIDFGSAVDPHTITHLYEPSPTSAELTLEYAPPEALFGRYWEGSRSLKPTAFAHDIWSAGVVFLELVSGTPHVFELEERVRAALEKRLKLSERPDGDRQLLLILRGMMDLCIYPPEVPREWRSADSASGGSLVASRCSDLSLEATIAGRDPLGLGFSLQGEELKGLSPDRPRLAVGLLRRMLHWSPEMRPTARQALQHRFFSEEDGGREESCASFGEPGWC